MGLRLLSNFGLPYKWKLRGTLSKQNTSWVPNEPEYREPPWIFCSIIFPNYRMECCTKFEEILSTNAISRERVYNYRNAT